MRSVFTVTILSLCLASFTLAAQGNCPASFLCKGCNDDSMTCSACFNLNNGSVLKAKMLGNTCATDVTPKIPGCKYYKDTMTASKTVGDCTQCDSKKWMNIEDSNTSSNILISCSDTSISTTTCDATIANCDQSFCFKNTSNTFVKGCRKCASGYKGNGTLTTALGYASCVNTNVIANCEYADPINNTKCRACKSGYAVASANDTTCEAFTKDWYCRKLGAGFWCQECDDGYYFDGQTCAYSASLMVTSSALLAIMAFIN